MSHSFKVGVLFSTLLLTGCLGDGSDSTATGNSGGSSGGSSSFTVTVSGVAMAGPISGTVCAYALASTGTVGNQLACAQTNAATGAYSLQIQNYVGDVLLKAWGQYVDEATKQTMTIGEANALRSISRSGSSGDRTAAITPITEAVIRAAGTLTEANFNAAATKLASALGMASNQVFNTFFSTLPAQGNVYREMLNHWSQAQKTYCTSSGAPTGCDLNAHLQRISTTLNTTPTQLRDEINAAMNAWQAANPTGASCQFSQAGSIVCSFPGTSSGSTSSGGGTSTGGTTSGGTYTLTVVTTASGVTAPPVVLKNVPKPANQNEFCSEVNSQTSSLSLKNQLANVGGNLTINSCSFNGTTGTVSATITLTSPISMSVPYNVTYTYSH